MLTNAEHPVAWAMLMNEVQEAHEHLGKLLAEMGRQNEIDEADFAVQIAHVFAHLNRAWHGRNDVALDQCSGDAFRERSRFPVDLRPVG